MICQADFGRKQEYLNFNPKMAGLVLFCGLKTRTDSMIQYLQWLATLFILILSTIGFSQDTDSRGGCEVIFELYGYDTLCNSSAPFNVAPGLPFGGVYSGPGMVADFFDPSLTGPGQFTITYTYDDGVCSGSASAVMTVLASEGLSFRGELTACSGDTVLVTSPNGEEYTWENGVKNDSMIFILDESITTYASGLDPLGCNSTTFFDIQIADVPSLVLQGPVGVCLGEVATYTVSGVDAWEWFTGSTAPTFTTLPSSSFTVSVSTVNGICDTTASIDVLVQPYPNLMIDPPSAVCFGDYLVLEPTGGTLYKGPDGFFTETQSILMTQTATISVTAYNDAGCEDQDEFTVFVIDLPDFTLAAEDSICFGESAQASIAGGIGYTWTDLNTNEVVHVGPQTTIQLSPEVSTEYEVSVASGGFCSAEGYFFVEVLSLPELVVEELSPVCTNRQATVAASGAIYYEWNNATNDNPYTFLVNESINLSLSGVDEFGCENTINYFLEASESPVVSVLGTPIICEGDSVTLTASGATEYFWPDGSTGLENVIYPIADTIVFVSGTNLDGCEDFTNYQIIVLPAPELQVNGEDTICAGEILNLQATSDFAIQWPDGSGGNEFDVLLVQDSVIHVTSQGANGCIARVDFDCEVRPFPFISVEGDTEICAGETTTLTASGPAQLNWNVGNQGFILNVTPVTNTNYYITGTDDFGCEVTNQIPIIVHPTPYVYFVFSTDTTCNYNQTLSWSANPPGGVYSGDGVVGGVFLPSEANDGLNTVFYLVTNEFGCFNTSSDEVYVEECVGINEIGLDEFVVYPNPTEGIVHFVFSRNDIDIVEIFDARGVLVQRETVLLSGNLFTMNVDHLSAGVYQVVVINREGLKGRKSIVIR